MSSDKIDPIKRRIYLSHNQVLSAFKTDYYKGLITKDNLGEETVIKVGDKQIFIYPIKYQNQVLAIPSDIVENNKLPIKFKKPEKVAYARKVYYVVKKFSSVKIVDEKTMDFRKLVDTIADFPHTEPEEYTIYKIVNLMLYLRKGYARAVSTAGFGKNSMPGILKILLGDISVINPRSAAAFEHKLINKFIVLDELTNLEKNQRDLMQEALLKTADNSDTYEKGTRASAKMGTKDEYNISELSQLIIYNIFEYYQSIGDGDKYFDFNFQPAVLDRFLPLYFSGNLNAMDFGHIRNPKKIAKELEEDIKSMIRAIKYYDKNLENELKPYSLDKEYKWSKSGRQELTFYMICEGLNLYAKDEKEYRYLVEKLYQLKLRYDKMANDMKVEEVPLNEVIN